MGRAVCHFVLGEIKKPDKLCVLSLGNMIRQSEIGTPGGVVSGTMGSCGLTSLTRRGDSRDLTKFAGVSEVQEWQQGDVWGFCWISLILLFRKGIADKGKDM